MNASPNPPEVPVSATEHPPVEAADLKRLSEADDFPHTAESSRGWMETAAMYSRNADFYRSIIVEIGELFGDAAKTSDDGSLQGDVLALKVPELVRAALTDRPPTPSAPRDELRALAQGREWLRDGTTIYTLKEDGWDGPAKPRLVNDKWFQIQGPDAAETAKAIYAILAQADTGSRGEDGHPDNRKEVMPNGGDLAGAGRPPALQVGEHVTSPREAVRASGGAPAGQDQRRDREDEAGYEVLATIYDGTRILAPKTRSKKFTTEEIRKAVSEHFALPAGSAPPPEAGAPEDQGRAGPRANTGHRVPRQIYWDRKPLFKAETEARAIEIVDTLNEAR